MVGACLWHKPKPYRVCESASIKCKDECGYDAIWETLENLFVYYPLGLVSHYLSLFSTIVSKASLENSRAFPAGHYSRAATKYVDNFKATVLFSL